METKKIVCTYNDFSKYSDVFDKMSFRANEYVPDLETIKKTIVPHLPKYMLFLLWIEATGYETKENVKNRKLIKQIIQRNFMLVDSRDGDDS